MRQPRRSLRSTTARFLRNLLGMQPGCASLIVDHHLIEALFDQLLELNAHRDTLVNSSVLSLLQLIATDSHFSALRAHLVRAHRPQLQALAGAKVQFVRDLLNSSGQPTISGEENRPPASPVKSMSIAPEVRWAGPGSQPQPPPYAAVAPPARGSLAPTSGGTAGGPLMPRLTAASLAQ